MESINITKNKKFSNVFDIKVQSREVSIDELKDKLKIGSHQETSLDSITEDCLITHIKEESWDHKIKRKHCKVEDSAKLKILSMHFKESISRDQISNILFIPYSTVSRVIREFNSNTADYSHWFESKTIKVCESEAISRAIRAYIRQKKDLFISSDISKYIRQTYNVTL